MTHRKEQYSRVVLCVVSIFMEYVVATNPKLNGIIKKVSFYTTWGTSVSVNAILNTYIDSNSIYREKMTELEVAKNINGKFQIYKSSPYEPYYPIFKANFPIQSLNSLTRNLANYLAQPAIDGWNGQEIRELCVA